jgi:hypothetical protein
MYNQMYEDVPSSNMPNKVRVIELVNENVTIPNQLNILKEQSLLPFFLLKCYKIKICQKGIVENHLKTQVLAKNQN